MLEGLGLAPQTEAVYLAVLKKPAAETLDLAASLDLAERQVRESLDELTRMSLLQQSTKDPQRLRPVYPEAALQALVARREAEFARLQQELEEGKAAVVMLLAEHAEMHPPVQAPDVEYVEGADAIESRLRDLTHSSRWEICSFVPAQSQFPLSSEANESLQTDAVERGVRYRTVFLDSIRYHQPALERAQWLMTLGTEVRTAPLLPLQLFIIDREYALVPLDPGATSDAAAIVSSVGMVTALLALFQATWNTAAPLGVPRRRDGDGLCPQRKQVLRLLAAGCTDDVIARRLGVSIRTARRVASDLLARLNARSRFQAGARAVVRGWLDVDDLDNC
jgi:sugar-specific transcriptional regulator TrmB/DNA-binding CsgD family transcriptional regulator